MNTEVEKRKHLKRSESLSELTEDVLYRFRTLTIRQRKASPFCTSKQRLRGYINQRENIEFSVEKKIKKILINNHNIITHTCVHVQTYKECIENKSSSKPERYLPSHLPVMPYGRPGRLPTDLPYTF